MTLSAQLKTTVAMPSTAERVIDRLSVRLADPSLSQDERRLAIAEARETLGERRGEIKTLLRQYEAEWQQVENQRVATDDLLAWMTNCLNDGMRIERPVGSALHKIHSAIKSGEIIYFEDMVDVADPSILWPEINSDQFNSFLVEHDWAAAFQNATDFADGEIHLPFDYCCFEFRFSGKRVCIFTGETDGQPRTLFPVVETKSGWLLPRWTYRYENDKWKPATVKPVDDIYGSFIAIAYRQIRAVYIALDAEVATREIVRAPHKLNAQRVKSGKPPLVDYHVVSLVHRSRVVALEGEPSGRHYRLHFVRGHWRHYESHKTWIKWHLRGDPDLGFIDKHYRL